MDRPQVVYSFTKGWTFWLFSVCIDYKWNINNLYVCLFLPSCIKSPATAYAVSICSRALSEALMCSLSNCLSVSYFLMGVKLHLIVDAKFLIFHKSKPLKVLKRDRGNLCIFRHDSLKYIYWKYFLSPLIFFFVLL